MSNQGKKKSRNYTLFHKNFSKKTEKKRTIYIHAIYIYSKLRRSNFFIFLLFFRLKSFFKFLQIPRVSFSNFSVAPLKTNELGESFRESFARVKHKGERVGGGENRSAVTFTQVVSITTLLYRLTLDVTKVVTEFHCFKCVQQRILFTATTHNYRG